MTQITITEPSSLSLKIKIRFGNIELCRRQCNYFAFHFCPRHLAFSCSNSTPAAGQWSEVDRVAAASWLCRRSNQTCSAAGADRAGGPPEANQSEATKRSIHILPVAVRCALSVGRYRCVATLGVIKPRCISLCSNNHDKAYALVSRKPNSPSKNALEQATVSCLSRVFGAAFRFPSRG